MNKTIVVTQVFAKAELLKYSLDNLYKYGSRNWDEHYLLLKHYPINKEKNHEQIREYAKQYGCKVFDCEFDRGLHEGLNFFFEKNPQPAGTRMLGFDPDTAVKPEAKNFDLVMNEVMDACPNIPIVALWGVGVENKHEQLKQYEITIKEHNVLIHPDVEMYNLALFDLDWVFKTGGFKEPNAYYGGLECYFYQKMQETNKKLAYLVDYKECYDTVPNISDQELRMYKDAHLGLIYLDPVS